MRKEEQHIEQLVTRFFDGQTTRQEEQELYRFFAGKQIPVQLEKYKPLFQYFESGLELEFTEKEETFLGFHKLKKTEKLLIPFTTIAAAIIILLILRFPSADEKFNPFEGSYIVENGIRITDPDQIRDRIEQTWEAARQMEKEMEQKINRIIQYEKQLIVAAVQHPQNPTEELLNRFESETAREEIRKVLNMK